MINGKVKAFTIMEVTITMMVTAILIGITYTSYSIINKSYAAFQNKNETMADLTRLDHWIKRDFISGQLILKDADGLAISAASKVITYRFTPDYITRTSLKTDTFKFKTDSVITSFEAKPLDLVNTDTESNRLDELSFILTFENQKIPYHYHKDYSSEDLIKRNANALH